MLTRRLICRPLTHIRTLTTSLPTPTPPIETVDELAFELNKDEVHDVLQSSFLQEIKIQDPRTRIPERVKEAAHYVPLVGGYLSTNAFPDSPSPFQIYSQSTRVRGSPRLSVTKLLTDSWCELRTFYEVYSQTPQIETEAMRRGREEHLELEHGTHAELDLGELRLYLPRVVLTPVDEFCDLLRHDLIKVMQLLACGKAREIYVHGYINDSGVFDGDAPGEGETLVTGIVDLLKMEQPLEFKWPTIGEAELNESDEPAVFFDLDTFIASAAKQVQDGEFSITLCDVKTRRRKSVPMQMSVVDAAKQQVMVYQNFMKALGGSPEKFMNYWEEYCVRRGIDIDEPMSPEFVIRWMVLKSDGLFEEYRKLRDGEYWQGEGAVPCDFSYMKETFPRDVFYEDALPSLGLWKQAITPRFFLSRLSQLYPIVAQCLKGDLEIQYYHRGEMFKSLKFQQDETQVERVAVESLQFWMGKRPPKLIEKSFANRKGKCNFCEFAEYCGWMKDV